MELAISGWTHGDDNDFLFTRVCGQHQPKFLYSKLSFNHDDDHFCELGSPCDCSLTVLADVILFQSLCGCTFHLQRNTPDHLGRNLLGVDRGVCSAGGDCWCEDKCRRDTGSGNRSICSVQVELLWRISVVDNKELFFQKLLRTCVRLTTRPQVLYRQYHRQKPLLLRAGRVLICLTTLFRLPGFCIQFGICLRAR